MLFSLFRNALVLFCIFCIQFDSAHATDVEFYADGQSEVSLCGVIRHELRWGPPGFGETPQKDSRFTAWFVSFENPLQFRYVGERSEEQKQYLSEIQLSLDPTSIHKRDLLQLTGQWVAVTGRLWSATSQGDVTPVVLALNQVSSIKLSNRVNVCQKLHHAN